MANFHRYMLVLWVLVSPLVTIISSVGITLAAEFKAFPGQIISFDDELTEDCTHSMRGEIVSGDAKKFQLLLKDLPDTTQNSEIYMLCMDGNGGSFAEGIKIGKIIRNRFFGTRIKPDDKCASACALAFMHGRISVNGWNYDKRILHPGGTLAFHAPSLVLPNIDQSLLTKEVVEKSYSTAIEGIAELLAYTDRNDARSGIVPVSLISLMLSETDGFLLVDTLHKAFLWNIEVQANINKIKLPAIPKVDGRLLQMCENGLYFVNGDDNLIVPTLSNPAKNLADADMSNLKVSHYYGEPDKLSGLKRLFISTEHNLRRECAFTITEEATNWYFIDYYSHSQSKGQATVSALHSLPPETKIELLR